MESKSEGKFEHVSVSPEYKSILPVPETNKLAERQYESIASNGDNKEKTQLGMPSIPIPVAIPLPQPSQITSTDDDDVVSDGNPTHAADEDLIEKEWVDKARKIIQSTKDDPSRREREVSKLQADYLMKRYGKQLGKTE